MKTLALALVLAAAAPAFAQYKMESPAGEAPGPWQLGTIGVGKGADAKTPLATALKGLAIKLGEHGEAGIAYDLDLCRVVGAWTGGKFVTPMNLMSRGEYPTALGEVAFTTGEVPGFWVEPPSAAGASPSPTGAEFPPAGAPPRVPGAALPAKGAEFPQKGAAPVSSSGAPATAGGSAPPSGGAPAAQNSASAAGSGAPVSRNSAPAASGVVAPTNGVALPGPAAPSGAQKEAPALQASVAPAWKDPRPEPFGPLPPGQARFKGFFVNGEKVILKWDIGGVEVLESPSYEKGPDAKVVIRSFQFSPSRRAVLLPVCPAQPSLVCGLVERDPALDEFEWREENGTVCLWVPPLAKTKVFRIYIAQYVEGSAASKMTRWRSAEAAPDFLAITHGGPARWPDALETTGELSPDKTAAYVVDTVKLPDPNPWHAPLFLGGLDFFPDGRAAVCTFHGDVFVVSGLGGDLSKVTWRRFASGLYHALGLKVVKGEIYVTCRDGLWRLKDLNGDGEADFYEAFNFDVKVTKSFHEFVFDLQTDPAGNFYFAKAGPVKNGGRGFDEIMEHHGTLMRVSPDGAKLDVVATGFRAPNGIGCGPDGQLTSGDNEGTWTPACKINWIKPGGFYGVVPLSHRDPLPTDYDRPLCWLPKRIDNSGGGQVWASDKWGPWSGALLHLSYGQCALYGVMREETGGFTQGGVAAFPVKFQSGGMRARVHLQDGQLWVAGLRGWQTSGIKNGCLQRVRYTGAPTRMPVELHAKKDGIELRFACTLDTQAAADPQNWNVEVWNYLWSSAYGSPELSTLEPSEKPAELGKDGEPQFTKTQIAQKKHDPLEVKRVSIGTDDRSVFLEIPGLKPVMQMSIRYGIKSADGADMKGEVVNTIHALGE